MKNNELQRQLKLSKSASFKKALPIVVIQMLMLIAKLVYNSAALNSLIIHLLPCIVFKEAKYPQGQLLYFCF